MSFLALIVMMGVGVGRVQAQVVTAASKPTDTVLWQGCQAEREPLGLKAFVQANSALASKSKDVQTLIYDHRIQLEWLSIETDIAVSLKRQAPDAGVDMFESTNLTPELQLDIEQLRKQVPLEAGNNVQRLRWLVEAQQAFDAGEMDEAQSSVDKAIADGQAYLDRNNAGLISGLRISAQVAYARKDYETADARASAALQIISKHPERNRVLGAATVELLELRADIAHTEANLVTASPLEPKSRQSYLDDEGKFRTLAHAARRKLSLTLESPYFNILGLVPGMQTWAELANQSDQKPLLSLPAVEFVTLIAGGIPSGGDANLDPNDEDSTATIMSGLGTCVASVSQEAFRGEFPSANSGLDAIISAVDEHNTLKVLSTLRAKNKSAENDRDLDALSNFGDVEERLSARFSEPDSTSKPFAEDNNPYEILYSISDTDVTEENGLVASVVTFIGNNDLPLLARKVETSITPKVAMKTVDLVLAKYDDGNDDPDGQSAKMKAALQATLSRYGSQLWEGIDDAKTAAALLLREPMDSDAGKMKEAAQWSRKKALVVINDALLDFKQECSARGIKLDDDDLDEFQKALTSQDALKIADGVSGLFDAIGWQVSQVQGNDEDAHQFEKDIIANYRDFFALQKYSVAALEPHLRALESHNGDALDLAVYDSRPLFDAVFASFPDLKRKLHDEMAEGADETDFDLSKAPDFPIVNLVSAQFLTDPAARQSRWKIVTDLWDDSASWIVTNLPNKVQTPSPDTFDGLAERLEEQPNIVHGMEILSTGFTDYLYALSVQNRSADAVNLISYALPIIKAAQSSSIREGDKDALAQLVPDDLLATSVFALQQQGRVADAFAVSGIRERKAAFLGGFGLINNSVQPALPINDTSAYDQYLTLALTNGSGATWDDVLTAVDQAKKSSAADAELLSAAVKQQGPEAAIRFRNYLRIQASARHRGLLGHDMANAEQLVTAKNSLSALLPGDLDVLAPSKITVADLQNAMFPGETAVTTSAMNGHELVVSVSKSGSPTAIISQATNEDLRSFSHTAELLMVREVEKGDAAGLEQINGALQGLYTGIFGNGSTLAIKPGQDIIWSPGDDLQSAPIAALYSPAPLATPEGTTTNYLGLAHPLSYVGRLSALIRERKITYGYPANTSLAVGDIPFHGDTQVATLNIDVSRESPSNWRMALLGNSPTPMAKQDLRDFVTMTGGRSISDANATVSNLEGLPEQSMRFMLFHTHGLTRQRYTYGLVLYPPANPTEDDTGVLDSAGISLLPQHPQFVLLAACSTGAADRAGLEPYSGLVRSFFLIGAQAVLTSQMPVNEQAATKIESAVVLKMTQNPKLPPSEALRQAQRDVAGAGDALSEPALWGSMVFVGDGDRP